MTNNQTQNSKTPGLPFRVLIFRIWNLFEIWDLKIEIFCHHREARAASAPVIERDQNLVSIRFRKKEKPKEKNCHFDEQSEEKSPE